MEGFCLGAYVSWGLNVVGIEMLTFLTVPRNDVFRHCFAQSVCRGLTTLARADVLSLPVGYYGGGLHIDDVPKASQVPFYKAVLFW